MDGGSCGGRAKRQRSNSGAGKGVQAVLAMGSKGAGLVGPAPARRHPGRPTAANAAGGEMHPAPSVWCALAEGSIWAERPGMLQGFPVRHPGGMGTNTTRICSPGKFEQRRPGPRAPHPFRCAGMGVGCAAGGPLRRFDPGGPQTGEPQIRERSTYRWRFPGKCLRPPTAGGTDRRRPWITNPPGWTGCWCWPQRRP